MTADNWLILAILTVAVLLFVSDRLRVDVVALLVLVTLVLTGLLSPAAAFSGFASPAVVTVWGVFIISGALFESGVADMLARLMVRLAARDPLRLLVVLMLTVGLMSAFMNNIGAVAILLPAVVSMSRELGVSPSRYLMPLSFAALMGGNITLVGTPPNILASSILQDYGEVEAFQFFDFAPMGIVVLAAGILYMLLIGRHLLPDRTPGGELADEYPVREYLTELRLSASSPLIGRSVGETQLGQNYNLTIVHVRRRGETISPLGDRPLQQGDVLLIEGAPQDIVQLSGRERLQVLEGAETPSLEVDDGDRLHLAEVILAPRTSLAGQTLREIGFRARFGLSVLGLRHGGASLATHLGNIDLAFGDSLLVQGTQTNIDLLRTNPDFMVLSMPPVRQRQAEKAPLAIAILLAILVTVTLGWLDLSITILLGALLMIVTGVLTMDEAYEAIDWKSVFLIAGMLPLGIAMETTGTARLLADQLVLLIGDWGPLAVLGGIFVLTALLTEVISNAAATVLMVPIAIDAALRLDASAQSFVMAVVLAASTSFLMPVGHQVNVIIFGPGGYRFSDYARVGVGLNLLMLVLILTVLPIFWPL